MELELQEQCANICTIFWSTLSSDDEEFNSAKLWQCLSAPFSDCLSNPVLMRLKNVYDWSASLRNYSPKTEAATARNQCSSSYVQPMSSNLLFMLLLMLLMMLMPILVLVFLFSLLCMLLPIITMLLVFLIPVLLLPLLLLPFLLPVLLPTQISQ